MFPKEQRITKNKEFEKIFKTGKSSYSDCLGLKILKNDLKYSRAVVLVSKKVSKRAHIRNLIKRRLREIVKSYYNHIPASDIIVIALPASANKNFSELQTSFAAAFKKIRL